MTKLSRKRVSSALIAMLLILSAAFTFASCGEPAATEPDTQAPTVPVTEEPATEPDDDGYFDLTAFISEFNKDGELSEQVIHDADGIKLTATGIEYDPITGPGVIINAENSTDKAVLIQADKASVNGYMTSVLLDIEVAAEKSAAGELTVPYTSLAVAGIDRVADLEFSLRIMDRESYEVITTCDDITLTTTAAEEYEPEYDDSGRTVYDSDGFKIVLKQLDDSRTFTDGAALIVYMYNATDKAVSFQADDIKVNGYEFTSAMNTIVMPGKRAVDIVPFFEMDMEEYGIEEIDSVELSFKILDESNWKTLVSTDPISVEL